MSHKYLKDGTKMTKPSCEYHQKSYHAVMDYRSVNPDTTEQDIEKVRQAHAQVRDPLMRYATYTAVKQACRLSYPRIFAAVKAMHVADPYSVRFTCNRMGENTKFKLTKGKGDLR